MKQCILCSSFRRWLISLNNHPVNETSFFNSQFSIGNSSATCVLFHRLFRWYWNNFWLLSSYSVQSLANVFPFSQLVGLRAPARFGLLGISFLLCWSPLLCSVDATWFCNFIHLLLLPAKLIHFYHTLLCVEYVCLLTRCFRFGRDKHEMLTEMKI